MLPTVVTMGLVLVCSLVFQAALFSQASKQLDERAKKVATPQQDSWKQVDEINKETDKTKSRYQQAQQGRSQTTQKQAYTVKKAKPGTGSAYKKPSPPKKATSPKKK